MHKLTIALAGLAALTACADAPRDREAPATDAARRPLEIARAEEPRTTPPRASPEIRPAPPKPLKKRSTPTPRPEVAAKPEPVQKPIPVSEPSLPTDTAAPGADTASTPEPVTQPSGDTATSGYTAYPAAEPEPQPAEARPATPPPDAGAVLAVGTVIHATLDDSIHSRHDVSGKEVQGRVMQNVTGIDGAVLVPAGAPVRLTVTQVKPGRGDRTGVLEMRTDSITIEGRPRKLEATIQAVPHELRGRGVTGEEAAKVGVGAAGGAVVGRVITGDAKGAVIGGVVGAAGGAVVAAETAVKDVVVKARTPVALVLTAPLVTR
jgi:hypothetical protein